MRVDLIGRDWVRDLRDSAHGGPPGGGGGGGGGDCIESSVGAR